MQASLHHSLLSEKRTPPDPSNCIAIVCNGEMELTLKERIQKCLEVIGVDGGLNHCNDMEIIPKWAIGDFDSVKRDVLEKFSAVPSTSLLRAKDETDLEVAVDKARALSSTAQVIIFGGLGGRIDHTLGNIYLLLRNPANLFIESEEQLLFAIDASTGKIEIADDDYQTISLFPLYGMAKNVSLESQKHTEVFERIDKSKLFVFPFNEKCQLEVQEGILIVVLDKREFSTFAPLPKSEISMDLSLKQPIIQVFNSLIHQSAYAREVVLASDKERVTNIQDAEKHTFTTQLGQTISLIPFYGPANGLVSQGLKWELGPETVDTLNKEFIGISNVCVQEKEFSIEVQKGELLVITNDLIDMAMVNINLASQNK